MARSWTRGGRPRATGALAEGLGNLKTTLAGLPSARYPSLNSPTDFADEPNFRYP